MATITELKCPYCGKPVSSEEYERALEEFRSRAEEEYKEKAERDRSKLEEEVKKQREKYVDELENLKKIHNEQIRTIKDELQSFYDKQFENLKERYDELGIQRQKDYKESFEQKMAEYEKELCEKDRQFQELQNDLSDFKMQAIKEANASVRKEIDDRDTQIRRLKGKVDELGKQLSETQSERKGQVGEEHLLRILKDEFQKEGDLFVLETRGTSGADIIQQIRGTSGKLLDVTIGYDNKEGANITPGDIEKAKRDKESLGTDYFIIVSPNLPKNTAKAEKDGILFVNLDNIVAVAGIIRKILIDNSKKSASTYDQESKQRKMYDYIRGQDFGRQVESICTTHEDMCKLQDKEEKDHKTLWKKREALQKRLRKSYIDISSGIESIIEEQPNTNEKKDPIDVTNGDGKDKDHLQNNPKDIEYHEH